VATGRNIPTLYGSLSTLNRLPSTIDSATYGTRRYDVALDKRGRPLFNAVAIKFLLKCMGVRSRCNPATFAGVHVWSLEGEFCRWPNPKSI
jgi:hypothetical protein